MQQPFRIEPDNVSCHDCYVCAARLGDGDLLVTFSRTKVTRPVNMNIVGVRSADNGRTWGKPFSLIDTPNMLDYDPNIVAWDNKVLVISTTVPLDESRITTSTFYAVRSEDNGLTWSDPAEIAHPPYVYCSGKINAGVRFPDGTLAFGYSPDMHIQKGTEVRKDGDTWGATGVMISRDDGHTWTSGALVELHTERPPGLGYAINGLGEPALAVCRDGGLYMLMRTGMERLYEARSGDQGQTWSKPCPSGLTAHDCPSELCVFDHPRLGRTWLAVYDHSPRHRHPLAVAVSRDEGVTWSKPLIIRDQCVRSCYPACAQTTSGEILLVWQEDILESANAEAPAGKPPRVVGRQIMGCLLSQDEIGQLATQCPTSARNLSDVSG